MQNSKLPLELIEEIIACLAANSGLWYMKGCSLLCSELRPCYRKHKYADIVLSHDRPGIAIHDLLVFDPSIATFVRQFTIHISVLDFDEENGLDKLWKSKLFSSDRAYPRLESLIIVNGPPVLDPIPWPSKPDSRTVQAVSKLIQSPSLRRLDFWRLKFIPANLITQTARLEYLFLFNSAIAIGPDSDPAAAALKMFTSLKTLILEGPSLSLAGGAHLPAQRILEQARGLQFLSIQISSNPGKIHDLPRLVAPVLATLKRLDLTVDSSYDMYPDEEQFIAGLDGFNNSLTRLINSSQTPIFINHFSIHLHVPEIFPKTNDTKLKNEWIRLHQTLLDRSRLPCLTSIDVYIKPPFATALEAEWEDFCERHEEEIKTDQRITYTRNVRMLLRI